MQIQLVFNSDEFEPEKLAALNREALRQRVPLEELVKRYLRALADELMRNASAVKPKHA